MPKPPITLLPCTSSRIREYGYDHATQTLYLRFHGKSGEKTVYSYANVPLEVYEGLVAQAADPEGSVGRYFGEHIQGKTAMYPFTKIVDDDQATAQVAA